MKILYSQGGLGNQMFQYAYVRYLEQKGCKNIWIDTSSRTLQSHCGFELRRIFRNIDNRGRFLPQIIGRPLHAVCYIIQLILKRDLKNKSAGKLWIEGYWQQSIISDSIREVLLNDFTFSKIDNRNVEISRQIRSAESVSIHVRRGDYLSPANYSTHANICDLDYYRKAIEYMCEHVENPQFVIFSDDPQWVKENLNLQGAIIADHNSGQTSFRDMQLMSECRHNIIANSSFSWWGAWLNENPDKIVIAPAKWLQTSSEQYDKEITPPDWLRF